MPFELKEPRDFADDKIGRSEPQPGAQGQIVARGQKWLKWEAAEDARVLLRAADARRQILFGHRLSDGDEMGGQIADGAFRSAQAEIGQRSLKTTKGRTVDRVND